MDTVVKTELARRLAEAYPLFQSDAHAVIDVFLDVVKAAVEAGSTVRLTGFGSFSIKAKPARKSRNPRTGETVDTPESRKLVFKASKTAVA